MIFPQKHIKLNETCIGLGFEILKMLEKPKTVDDIWRRFEEENLNNERFVTLDDVFITLDFLFTLGAIKLNNGKLSYASN